MPTSMLWLIGGIALAALIVALISDSGIHNHAVILDRVAAAIQTTAQEIVELKERLERLESEVRSLDERTPPRRGDLYDPFGGNP